MFHKKRPGLLQRAARSRTIESTQPWPRMQNVAEIWCIRCDNNSLVPEVLWAAIICGIALLIAGFFAYFGTSPNSPR